MVSNRIPQLLYDVGTEVVLTVQMGTRRSRAVKGQSWDVNSRPVGFGVYDQVLWSVDANQTLTPLSLTAPCRITASQFRPAGQEILLFLRMLCPSLQNRGGSKREVKLSFLMLPKTRMSWSPEAAQSGCQPSLLASLAQPRASPSSKRHRERLRLGTRSPRS